VRQHGARHRKDAKNVGLELALDDPCEFMLIRSCLL
jgi:hypothetical protein